MNLLYRIRKKLSHTRARLFPHWRPSSAPYLSGDTFRAYANHVHDETQTFDPKSVTRGDHVFLKTDFVEDFFTKIHPHIPAPYILITHNSDAPVGVHETAYIDDRIIAWFAQNNTHAHERVIPLPIGLENRYFHTNGIPEVFNIEREKQVTKKPRILYGFNPQTNPVERIPAQSALQEYSLADPITGWPRPAEYLSLLNGYSFVASPPGNGVDCIRTWEAMYVGTIPIVKRSVCTEYFASLNLPLLLIDSWDELGQWQTEADVLQLRENILSRTNNTFLWADTWATMMQQKINR